MAELAEEYPTLTKKIIKFSIWVPRTPSHPLTHPFARSHPFADPAQGLLTPCQLLTPCLPQAILAVHPMLWIFEPFPFLPVAFGIATHAMYYRLLVMDFPFIELTSANFLGSCGTLAARCAPPDAVCVRSDDDR